MGAFYLVRRTGDSGSRTEEVSALLSGEMALQGFCEPKTFSDTCYEFVLYPKQNGSGGDIVEFDNGDFCACTGTLIYREQSGVDALKSYYRDFSVASPPSEHVYGAFCIIIKKNGALSLLVDRLGVYKVYRDSRDLVWSSSFLAVSSLLENPVINVQSVYEFVFQGASYGNETVFRDVQIVDCDYLYQIDGELKSVARGGNIRDPQPSTAPMESLLDDSVSALRTYYRSISACFTDRIDTALSGGYDSRLTLALLLEQGVSPDVHVYGKHSDADVRVACEIDRQENLGLKHIDKSAFPAPGDDEIPGIVDTNYHVFDGFPTDGIFNNGADLLTRKQRCASGGLMLNGGGGEVFRNFFYLPDRSYPVRKLLWTFYSQFDPVLTTRRFNEDEYHARLGEKICSALGTEKQVLTRTEVELAYPLFRCRYWMGKNNSINNRLGYALTPFIDYEIVKQAIKIPVSYKNHGTFEAALIREVSPALASYMSDYGHNFMSGPDIRHILSDTMTLLRPPRLRRYLYRIKSRRLPVGKPRVLSDSCLENVMDANFPYLGELFRVRENRDIAQYNRICTLEYLFQKTSARLV